MTVGELRARLNDFDDSLPIRALANDEADATFEIAVADLPAHEGYVLLHDRGDIEAHPEWSAWLTPDKALACPLCGEPAGVCECTDEDLQIHYTGELPELGGEA